MNKNEQDREVLFVTMEQDCRVGSESVYNKEVFPVKWKTVLLIILQMTTYVFSYKCRYLACDQVVLASWLVET